MVFVLVLVFSCSLGQPCRREGDVVTCFRFVRREFEGTRIMKIAEVNAPRLDLSEFEDFELLQIVKSRQSCTAIERNQRKRIILGSKECSRVSHIHVDSQLKIKRKCLLTFILLHLF